MIQSHSDRDIVNCSSACQRSCTALLWAEKASAFNYLHFRPTSVQPRFFRLDGWNPHEQWFRQPPNLANHFLVRIRVYTRVRDGSFLQKLLTAIIKNRLARLGGWQSQCQQRFAPSNLLSNHFFRLDR